MFNFKNLIWFSAITIALVAAFFSVTGIATLFSGKFWAVFVMASALEIGKLVSASFLYRYWKTTPGMLKTYMSIGVVILMLVTSMGIYGYLSAAYAEIAAVPQNTINQISAIDTRQTTLIDNVQRMQDDNVSLERRRSQVQTSLDNVLSGNTDLSQRSAFANLRTEIELLDVERRGNIDAIAREQLERDSLENVKVQLNADLNTNSEVGTFIYISRTLGVPLDTVVKWFVLIIVFVFDPLAMSLILAYNNIAMQEQRQRGPPRVVRQRGSSPKKAETVTTVPEELMEKAEAAAANTDPGLLSGRVEEEFSPEQTMEEFIDHVPTKEPSLEGYIPARDIIQPPHTNVYGEEMPGTLASEKTLGQAKVLKGPRKGSWVHIVDHSDGEMTAVYTDPSTGASHRFRAAEAKFGPIQITPIHTGWSLGARIEPPRS